MKTYFMAAEIRNDHDNIVNRANATYTSDVVATEVFERMVMAIARKHGCHKLNVFAIAFNSV